MREINRSYRVGRSRRRLMVRWWGTYRPLRQFWRWLTLRREAFWEPAFQATLRTHHGHQLGCYCPTGTTTDLRLVVFGCGVWVSVSRDLTARPCSCDKLVLLMFPEGHDDEIEAAGGLAALQAEFPGVEAL